MLINLPFSICFSKLFSSNLLIILPRMSGCVAVDQLYRRLEERANQSEEMIHDLKFEIQQIKSLTPLYDSALNEKIQKFKLENARLQKEVEEWRKRLIKIETENGIKQIPLPNPTSDIQETKVDVPSEEVISKQKKQMENKTKKEKTKTKQLPKEKTATNEEETIDISKLDLRIGRVLSANKHPDADSLYVEQIELGEEKPRTVVSGLVRFVPLEQLQNRLVVLVCNLKPAKMRGILSEAMVLCASTPDRVEPLDPPTSSVPGDIVKALGYESGQPEAQLNPKKKFFETVAPDLKTDVERVARYKDAKLFVVGGKGFVTAATLAGAPIK